MLNQRENQEFGAFFVEQYLKNGFGSLPKSEVDLIVFHMLVRSSACRGKSNYELASILKIPEARIKTLRLNSALKYEEINSKAVLGRVVIRLVGSEQFASFESGKVEISLEDPVEKRELENFLKKKGHHAEYQLNAEVLKIDPVRLFELIVENVDRPKSEFNQLIQAHLEDQVKAEELANNALTLKQKFAGLRREVLSANTMRALLGAASRLLVPVP
ncbi:MAG: hypothetical protein ACSHXK_15425 [Oceanococcus sp.]